MAQQSASNNTVNRLIIDYLESKGFANALAAFEQELGVQESHQNMNTTSVILSNLAEALFVQGIHDGSPDIYQNEYNQFISWIASSLDQVKPYYQALSFALFVHCYLGILKLQKQDEARTFWDKYSPFHKYEFTSEIQSLSLVQSKDSLQDESFLSSNIFLKSFSKSKIQVKISALAFQILSQFLATNSLSLIATILNDKIELIKVLNEDEQTIDLNLLFRLEGYTSDSQNNHFAKDNISFGVPGTGAISAQLAKRFPLFKDINFPSVLNDPLYKAWLERIIHPQLVLEKLKKRSIDVSNNNRIDDDERSSLWTNLPDGEKPMVNPNPKGDAQDPSIIFATLGDTDEGLNCLDINSSVTQMASGFSDGIVRLWRLDSNKANKNNETPYFGKAFTARKWEMNEVLPATKSTLLAKKSKNNVGEATTSSSSSNETTDNQRYDNSSYTELVGHSLSVFSVHQNPSGRLVLSSSADETVRLWDTSVLQTVGKYSIGSIPWDVKFHPLEYYFATANQDCSVSIYSTDRLAPLRLFTGHKSDVNTVQWHDNGVLLLSGSDDKSLRLWDIRTAECVRLFRGSGHVINSCAISTTGNIIAAGNEKGRIYLWDARSSKVLSLLHGHEEPVNSLAFSPDSTTLTSGSNDCSIRIWDLLPTYNVSMNTSNFMSNINEQIHSVIKAKHIFFTKATPVYKVGFTQSNLVFGAGPYSLAKAATFRATESNEHQLPNVQMTEKTAAKKLGLINQEDKN